MIIYVLSLKIIDYNIELYKKKRCDCFAIIFRNYRQKINDYYAWINARQFINKLHANDNTNSLFNHDYRCCCRRSCLRADRSDRTYSRSRPLAGCNVGSSDDPRIGLDQTGSGRAGGNNRPFCELRSRRHYRRFRATSGWMFADERYRYMRYTRQRKQCRRIDWMTG